MRCDELELSARVKTALTRAGFLSVSELFSLPLIDLQTTTNLSQRDVKQLLSSASASRPPPITGLQLLSGGSGGSVLSSSSSAVPPAGLRLSLGCPLLDGLLCGGLPLGGITELSGESGAGKTQLALQLCLSVQYPESHGGLDAGVLYICTEDVFPIKRLNQLIRGQSSVRPDVPPSVLRSRRFSDHVYVHHAPDLASLLRCLSQAPPLLALGRVRLLILDSVAALFRSEFQASDWLLRNKQLMSVSHMLKDLSWRFNIVVLCINQVTDVFSQSEETSGPSSSSTSPSLGLAWANQVMVRLRLLRLPGQVSRGEESSAPRRLEVDFAPHLARDGVEVGVWGGGFLGDAPRHTEDTEDTHTIPKF